MKINHFPGRHGPHLFKILETNKRLEASPAQSKIVFPS
ncbi:hypothetical protein CP10881SC42_0134 [Chlamydia avium]|uniref:Uncharacterized protein n=1 Tax=Chlamydia avium TaxID=1457141 RepID=A0ABN0MSY9_9CHLA|nr:hypothetical protein CP10743SC13_0047 [Chlamydia psittaci 10_743_SC13]EPP38553.1 hypothetical protein CP10881SC42_0134 [Chlamydia avium]